MRSNIRVRAVRPLQMRRRQGIKMKPETSKDREHYIIEDCEEDKYVAMESNFKMDNDLDSSDSDSGSSSTDDSSDCANSPPSKNTNSLHPIMNKNSVCVTCGRGPFKSLKLHLPHCSGLKVKYQCFLCKEVFKNEKLMNQHYMSLYSCDVCGQVFSHESMYRQHHCPRKSKSPLVLFCSESMPQVCNICKSFFTNDKTLLNHVAQVHTSVVSTKVCIITNPAALTNKKVASAGQSANGVPNVVNGKIPDGNSYLSFLSNFNPESLTSESSSSYVKSGKEGDQNLPPQTLSPDKSSAASKPESLPTPTILALFENDSHEAARLRQAKTGWRSKTPHVCKQCGAIFRQPSLIISHRYLHRGPRLYRCQCGRAFMHRLHLLRHCVEHAESINYICVSCGETFTGAKVLAEHIKGKSSKISSSGHAWKCKEKKKCRMPFTCDCGQLFFRPSAFIWHQLKNRAKAKCFKKPLK